MTNNEVLEPPCGTRGQQGYGGKNTSVEVERRIAQALTFSGAWLLLMSAARTAQKQGHGPHLEQGFSLAQDSNICAVMNTLAVVQARQ